MKKIKALLIPADPNQEVRVVEIADDGDEVAQLVFGEHYPQRRELSFSPFHTSMGLRVQLAYDDLGLLRSERTYVNVRAQALWALLTGRLNDDFAQPLVGNFVALGFDEEGETTDVPEHYARVMLSADEMTGGNDG